MSTIEYVEAPLEEVCRHFTQNFKPHTPAQMQCLETFVDTAKGKVIFKMLTTPVEVPAKDGDGASGD